MERVILVGFMGCGKTTLGKKLANKLSLPFIDSDSDIEKRYQQSIGELFTRYGESHFRETERQFIDPLFEESAFVLATGGGMPCFGDNMELLKQLGTTFYLERSPKELVNRLIQSKTKRPLLEGMSADELTNYVERKLAEREIYYHQADFTLGRDEQNVNAIQKILHHLTPLQKS